MTYTCTVAWCSFDGRSMASLLRHIRQCHPWLEAKRNDAPVSPFVRRALARELPGKVVA